MIYSVFTGSARLLLLFLFATVGTRQADASVLTPGEDPGQFGISAYIGYNSSDLPYPPANTTVGTGFLRYESRWLDQQVKTWDAWVECFDTYGSGEECDAFYDAIQAEYWDEDIIAFNMTALLIDARFDMYGVTFTESDVEYWHLELGYFGMGLEPASIVIDMRQSNGDRVYWGAGGDDYVLELILDGHYGSNMGGGSCYAEHPDRSWTEDLCYDMSIYRVATPVHEPDTLLLVALSLAGLGLSRRRKPA